MLTPITDWSPEGRLVTASDPMMRLLLDEAFTRFDEEDPIPWKDFGFRSDDPIPEAVDWCVQRFAGVNELDPALVPPELRSFRLFTQAGWWLSQKVTTQGFLGIMARRRRADGGEDIERIPAPDPADDGHEGDEAAIESFVSGLGATLKAFFRGTCDDLVAYWFDGTKHLRQALGHTLSAPTPDDLPNKQSLYRFDAMFRFWQLHMPGELGAPWRCVLELTMLTACDNAPPYRVPDKVVSQQLRNDDGPREVGRARKTACAKLVVEFAQRRSGEGQPSLSDRLAAEFTRAFLKPTLLHALEIQGHTEIPAGLLKEVSRGKA